jgi:hypothetical protein
LTHKKLNKLVYVNYNLRLRLEDVSNRRDDEGDIIEHLGQLSFYDEKNPAREWMEYGRCNREPVLDEEDEDSDIPIPSQLVRDQIDPKDLQTATGDDCISDWARRNVGSSHIGKRLFQSGPKQSDPKRQKGKTKTPAKQVTSDASTDDDDGQRSPPYQESGDSSLAEDDGDDDGDGDGGGGDDGDGDGDSDDDGGGGGIRFTSIHMYIYTHV